MNAVRIHFLMIGILFAFSAPVLQAQESEPVEETAHQDDAASEDAADDESVETDSSDDDWEEIDAKIAGDAQAESDDAAVSGSRDVPAQDSSEKVSADASETEDFAMPADAGPLMRALFVDEDQIEEEHVIQKHQRLIDSWQDSQDKRYDSYFGAAGNY